MSDDDDDKKEKENSKSKKKNKKEPQTFIHENEDQIVDLADPNAFSKITSKNTNLMFFIFISIHILILRFYSK